MFVADGNRIQRIHTEYSMFKKASVRGDDDDWNKSELGVDRRGLVRKSRNELDLRFERVRGRIWSKRNMN